MKKAIHILLTIILALNLILAAPLSVFSENEDGEPPAPPANEEEDTGCQEHQYDNACDTDCNLCGGIREAIHNYSDTLTFDDTNHYYLCADCGAKKDDSAHSFDNGCDPSCNSCGFTRQTDHVYATEYSADETNHWYACTGEACTSSSALAPHSFDNECDADCNDCGYVRASIHIYTDNCDTNCDLCGAERTAIHNYGSDWSGDGIEHWHECADCGNKKDKNAHFFDNDCDSACNTCGHTRVTNHKYSTAWAADSSSHWHECIVCGNKIDSVNHTPGPAATETTPQRCTVCNHIITPALNHTHSFGQGWVSDREYHWHGCDGCNERRDTALHVYDNNCDITCNVCGYQRFASHTYTAEWYKDGSSHWYECQTCGMKIELSRHSWDGGQPSGSIYLFTCTTCGHQKQSTTSVLPPEDTEIGPDATNKPQNPSSDTNNQAIKNGNWGETNSTTTVMIIIAVAVIGVCGATATLFVFKKQ